jgi:AbrB family looped-hinge helix DNA binding protein
MTVFAKIAPNGRMTMPAGVRKQLGLPKGGAVIIEHTDDGVTVKSVAQIVERVQALVREHMSDHRDASVDAFIANRVADSGE